MKIKSEKYKDGSIHKYKNSRVLVSSFEKDKYIIQMKTLSNDLRERTLHKVIGDKIVVTTLAISKESAISLIMGLTNLLAKDGLNEKL